LSFTAPAADILVSNGTTSKLKGKTVRKVKVEEVEKDQKKEAPYNGDVIGDEPLKPCTLGVIVHPRSHLSSPGDCFV